MIHKLSHTTLYVTDQERAKAFYTEKLGFEVTADQMLGNFRWLTVSPKGQSEPDIVLMSVDQAPSLPPSTSFRSMARGVQFRGEPQERFYGIEATFQDDSGNWFSLTQRT